MMDRKGKINFLTNATSSGSSMHFSGGKSRTTQTEESCALLRNRLPHQKYSNSCPSCNCCVIASTPSYQQAGQFFQFPVPWFSPYPPAYAGSCLSLGIPPFIPVPMNQWMWPCSFPKVDPNLSPRSRTDLTERIHNMEAGLKSHHHSDDTWKPTNPIKSEPNFTINKKYSKRYIEPLHHSSGRYCSDTAIPTTNNKYKNESLNNRYYTNRDKVSKTDSTRIDYSCSEILSAGSVYKYADMRMHELSSSLQGINENIAKLSDKTSYLGPSTRDSAAADSHSYLLNKGVYNDTFRKVKRSRITPLGGESIGRKEDVEQEEEKKRYNQIMCRSIGGYGDPLRCISTDTVVSRGNTAKKSMKPTEDEIPSKYKICAPRNQQVPVKMKSDDQQIMKRKDRSMIHHQRSEEDKKLTTSLNIRYDPKAEKSALIEFSPSSEAVPKEDESFTSLRKDEKTDTKSRANNTLQPQKDHQQIQIENWLENSLAEASGQPDPTVLRRQLQYSNLEVLSKISEEDEDQYTSSSNQTGKEKVVEGNSFKVEEELEEEEEDDDDDDEDQNLEEQSYDALFHHMNRKERDCLDTNIYLEEKPGNTWIR